ncbi:hypothetical protein LP420_15410 [Massilia sp. B-10]|nr:hypothetical protein LP420_15410 [Massilia sp. B-10]
MLAPQLPDGEAWDALTLKALLDTALKKYNVDRGRVYLTGLSLGGYGAWDLATRYPHYFAAVAPICGGGIAQAAGAMRAIPTWVFHGRKDDAVPEEESAHGGRPESGKRQCAVHGAARRRPCRRLGACLRRGYSCSTGSSASARARMV